MKPATFRATYSDWRLIKGRKVVQVVFELPLEQADQAYEALGGMPNPAAECWCGIARLVQPAAKEVITQDDPAGVNTQPASTSPPGRAPDKKLAQLAGMLSKTPLFHRYLEKQHLLPDMNEQKAADFIRQYCEVASRSHLSKDDPSGYLFLELHDDFKNWEIRDKVVETS